MKGYDLSSCLFTNLGERRKHIRCHLVQLLALYQNCSDLSYSNLRVVHDELTKQTSDDIQKACMANSIAHKVTFSNQIIGMILKRQNSKELPATSIKQKAENLNTKTKEKKAYEKKARKPKISISSDSEVSNTFWSI